jgi:predicted nucleic acid-binding protein
VILVDTSIWIDHLHRADEILSDLLDRQQVVMHPFVIGELALGNLNPRDEVLWTRDRRLATAAERLSLAARVTH